MFTRQNKKNHRYASVAFGATFFVLGLALFVPVTQVKADSSDTITVTATVEGIIPTGSGNPTVDFRGQSTPNSVITILRNDVKIGEKTANMDGTFELLLSDEPTGQVTYTLRFVDTDGRSLPPLSFAFSLALGSSTFVSGIFPGPSISINTPSVKLGQPVTISGMTAPGGSVALTVHSAQPVTYTISADLKGIWQQIVDTLQIGTGSHTAQARTSLNNSISGYSNQVDFSVNPLAPCDGKKSADVNCDGHVNLTDFSILLYFWQKTKPSNPRADINQDGIVNLTDFSIMLYQWTN